jgi:tRNA-dihydrouridine synthase B
VLKTQPQQNNPVLKILKSKVALAPMAGITDYVLRSMIRHYCPECLLTTEMISSEFLAQNRNQTEILMLDNSHHPISYQICGHKPFMMADAARRLSEIADIIDINMGCPVRKVVCGHDGSALMREPELAYDIVQAVKESTSRPVSVKFRLGYTAQEMNYVEFGQKMQEAGAEFITLHARTRAQMYSGHADWEKIKVLKDNVDVPVFANGDVVSVDSAIECLEKSGADGVAVGRGVLGDPTLLYRINHYLNTGEKIPEPNLKEKIEIMKKHLEQEIELRSERIAIKFFRKFYPFYISGVPNASKYRGVLVKEDNYKKLSEYFDYILKENS